MSFGKFCRTVQTGIVSGFRFCWGSLKTQNRRREAFHGTRMLVPSGGCARITLQFHTVLQNPRSYTQTQVSVRTVFPLLVRGVTAVLHSSPQKFQSSGKPRATQTQCQTHPTGRTGTKSNTSEEFGSTEIAHVNPDAKLSRHTARCYLFLKTTKL